MPLLSEELKNLWEAVEAKRLTPAAFYRRQQRLLEGYRRTWRDALLLEGYRDLRWSVLAELSRYLGEPAAEIRRRCRQAWETIEQEWQQRVDVGDRKSIELFYDQNQAHLYELMWWHTLADDDSPLAYVTALHFARRHHCRRHLDFGAGVGSGSVLFARNGFDEVLADISTALLDFCEWRLGTRKLRAEVIDLKVGVLPSASFDIITAMDVFEHLVEPEAAVQALWDSLVPGGFLFGRFDGGGDTPEEAHEGETAEHIVHDFGPTFRRMEALGLVPVWQDEWLWGHRAFRKL